MLLFGGACGGHCLWAKDVAGTIVDQTWTTNNSPYRVVGDIQVASLDIQPGVTVLFESNYVFEVAGRLKAIGTPDAPITFSTTNGGWQGIYFNAALSGSRLAHCVIEKAVNSGIRIHRTTPLVSDCTIRSNTATALDTTSTLLSFEARGAGISTDSPLTLDNCFIHDNTAATEARDNNGAAATALGGGVYSSADLSLRHCLLSANSVRADAWSHGNRYVYAVAKGGAVFATNLTLLNCIIRDSTATAITTSWLGQESVSSAEGLGGGVCCPGVLQQTNTIISGNKTSASAVYGYSSTVERAVGGGVYVAGTGGSIVHCTFASNSPGGVASDAPGLVVVNSILWNNTPVQVMGTASVTYSDVQGGYEGAGNIDRNPIFFSTEDLIIVRGSPCMNAGDTNVVYRNVYMPPSVGSDQRSDMGAHGGPQAGARFRARYDRQCEVVLMGAVPGYTYWIQGSTDLLTWETVQEVQVAHLGDAAFYLAPSADTPSHRYYRLEVAP
jgi:hypothetical protein